MYSKKPSAVLALLLSATFTFATDVAAQPGLQDKLNSITIPQVSFSGMELTRVIETLSELSVVYDPEKTGIDILPLFNPNDVNPRVNISLRNLNLDRILQFVTQQVNFAYDVGSDAVRVKPAGEQNEILLDPWVRQNERKAPGRIKESEYIKYKLNSITIPQVNFSGMELTRVLEMLEMLSVEFDSERKGINIVPLFNPNDVNPRVNISLSNLNLDRVLQFVTQQVNFAYDVGPHAVTVRPL